MNTIRDFWDALHRGLSATYDADEIRIIGRILIEEAMQLSHSSVLTMDKDTLLSAQTSALLNEEIDKLNRGIPLQYVLGKTIFYGCDIRVATGVLIPRPETEELIEQILLHTSTPTSARQIRVLDIGTGSGCIPCALARIWGRDLYVDAMEYSPEAWEIAESNLANYQEQTGAILRLMKADLFECLEQKPAFPYDIIVSNPPYIHPDEASEMTCQVLEHEPSTALFAPAENPIIYYEAIARLASNGWLRASGKLFLELNPLYAEQTMTSISSILDDKLEQSKLIRCLSGKERMAYFQLV